MRSSVRLLLLVSLTLLALLPGCERQPRSVTLGFVGVMSGRSAGLGIDGRDGFLLAVHEANQGGGLDGETITPLVLDSGSDPQQTTGLLSRLQTAGVAAAIGPMRSQVATELVPQGNAAKLVLLSPTVSTDQVSGRDDYFFRNYPSNRQVAEALAELVTGQRKLFRIAVLYSRDNLAYTENYLRTFQAALKENGGEVVTAVSFSSLQLPDYSQLLAKIEASHPQGVLVLANAVDTAMFCQVAAKEREPLPVFATPWSFTDDLIAFGGQAVEGVALLLTIDPGSKAPRYLRFRHRFLEQYGREPRFSAIHAYDATRMLLEALRGGTRSGPEIKRHLLELGSFPGLQGEIRFDAFGDISGPELYPVEVRGGNFVVNPASGA